MIFEIKAWIDNALQEPIIALILGAVLVPVSLGAFRIFRSYWGRFQGSLRQLSIIINIDRINDYVCPSRRRIYLYRLLSRIVYMIYFGVLTVVFSSVEPGEEDLYPKSLILVGVLFAYVSFGVATLSAMRCVNLANRTDAVIRKVRTDISRYAKDSETDAVFLEKLLDEVVRRYRPIRPRVSELVLVLSADKSAN